MDYSLYQLSWIFVLCSFIGWILSTSAAAVREKKFVDVGFLYGPYCPAYGFGAVLFPIVQSAHASPHDSSFPSDIPGHPLIPAAALPADHDFCECVLGIFARGRHG